MTPFRRVLAEKRIGFAAAGIVLLADLLLYVLAVQPARAGVGQAGARAAQAARDAEARSAGVEDARARQAGAQRAGEQLTRFRADVLPRDLAQARDLTYPHLAALAARFGLDLQRRTSELDDDEDARFRRLEATLRLAGRYGDIRRFIEAVETGPEFLIIDAIALSRRETERGGGLAVTLGVSTWFPAAEESR